MDTEFSEFANALLALRMGKSAGKPTYPSISYSADDNDSTVCEEEDLFNSKMSANIVPFPSLSWAPQDFASTYGFVNSATPTKGKKRLHSVSLSATSSESNDSYDAENPNTKKVTNPSNGPAVEKKQSLARGRYRCSLCGAFKTNHVCALIADKLMCNMSTQSLQGNDLVASMLPAHQKELRVQCRSEPGISSSTISVENAPLSSAAILGSAASTSTTTSGIELTRVFHERIVTVTRNRTSIQHPEPAVPMSAVSYSATPMSMSTSEASNDGSTVLSLHKPAFDAAGSTGTGTQKYAQSLATASASGSGAHAVTPTVTYSFAPHFPPHLPSTQPAGLALPVGLGGYMYSNAMHSSSSLLSVPLQPSTLSSTAVPSFPQAPVKVAPSLIYPSALDLLGQAIYE